MAETIPGGRYIVRGQVVDGNGHPVPTPEPAPEPTKARKPKAELATPQPPTE